ASLIECSAALGAYLGGASEADLDVYGALGRSLGVAFQIVDDVLDLVGDEEVVGKTLGTDLENQKETLPVIFYLQNASRQEKDVLLKRLGGGVRADERADIAALLKGSGAIDAALAEAKRLVDAAVARLAELRKRAEGEGRTESLAAFDSLADLARFVVKRDK
ncbi:MAG: polyprenyl synthetase family protein, partial [Thermoguttaceae bacterium]|nr:polyprenyl synthetase family protein [Thermoguttaceae bacterium]